MKNLKLLIFSTVITLMFSACSAVVALASVADRPEKGWAKKAHFERLMKYPNKVLLSEDEKVRAGKNICELKHLDKEHQTPILKKYAKSFCKLKQDDKIYFFKDIVNTYDFVSTQYLLVRDGKAFEGISIDKKYSKELGRSVQIVERLH